MLSDSIKFFASDINNIPNIRWLREWCVGGIGCSLEFPLITGHKKEHGSRIWSRNGEWVMANVMEVAQGVEWVFQKAEAAARQH